MPHNFQLPHYHTKQLEMKRSTSIYTSLRSQQRQRLELKLSRTLLVNDEWPVLLERLPDTVDKTDQRGTTIISSKKNSTISDSILKQLASMELTTKKQESVSPYRTLLKKRALARRKNRVVVVDNKVVKSLSCEISSCVQVEPHDSSFPESS